MAALSLLFFSCFLLIFLPSPYHRYISPSSFSSFGNLEKSWFSCAVSSPQSGGMTQEGNQSLKTVLFKPIPSPHTHSFVLLKPRQDMSLILLELPSNTKMETRRLIGILSLKTIGIVSIYGEFNNLVYFLEDFRFSLGKDLGSPSERNFSCLFIHCAYMSTHTLWPNLVLDM